MNTHKHTTYLLQWKLCFTVPLSIYLSTLLCMCFRVSCRYQYPRSLKIHAHFSIFKFSMTFKNFQSSPAQTIQKWVQGIANHPSDSATVTTMDRPLQCPCWKCFHHRRQHSLHIYSMFTVCKSQLKPECAYKWYKPLYSQNIPQCRHYLLVHHHWWHHDSWSYGCPLSYLTLPLFLDI